MKIKAFTSATAFVACAVAAGALTAGLAAAQTAAPAARPAAAAPSLASTPAPSTAKPKPRHDMAARPMGPGRAPSFEDLDTNHDGVVSKAEFDAWRAAHPRPDRPAPGGDGPDGKGAGRDGMRGDWGGGFEMRREMMWMQMHEMEMRHGGGERFGPHFDFDAADTDHDGKVSWAEFQAAATAHLKERFDHLDANHDGFIEKDELPGRGEHRHHDGKDGKTATDAPPPPPAK